MSSTGFIVFPNQYISYISNIYNPNLNMRLASQMKCDKMFLDLELDHVLLHFSVKYLVYIYLFFSYVAIIHLLRRGGGVGIHYKWIPD